MHDTPGRCVDHQTAAFRDRVGNRRNANGERAKLCDFGPGGHGFHLFAVQTRLIHLAAGKVGSEGAGIDRCVQIPVEMRNRTDVVLMGVGDENPFQLVGPLFQPADVRHDEINTWGAVHIGECHPEVDQNKAFLARFAIAIDIGIHANFPCPTQGQVDQTFSAHPWRPFSLLYL